jgi:nitroreductase
MLKELIERNRSYRRFDESASIDEGTLKALVELARLSASAANRQPLKFMLAADPARNAMVFQNVAWAGYLDNWPGPAEGERPTGYIIILGDTTVSPKFHCDHGIAAQSILLGATERGLGGCMIGSVNHDGLRADLAIADHLQILLVIALGKPAETVVLETVGADGDIRYWRDEQSVHHVPKRPLEELIIA